MVFNNKPRLHIINRMELAVGGSENRSIQLQNLLKSAANVFLWSEYPSKTDFHKKVGVRLIQPRRLFFPKSGIFLFVGTYYWVGSWLRFAFPKRIIVIHNIAETHMLKAFLRRFREIGVRCPIDLVYASESMACDISLPGRIFPSPIDLNRFSPVAKACVSSGFTIGRLSRDTEAKHHLDDIEVYKTLAAKGIKIRIMGGQTLKPYLEGVNGIEILAAGSQPAEEFIKSLDVFFYRTSPQCFEASGRVVVEAMASGLPVVCGWNGGYRDFVKHGVNGFLFHSNSEAIDYILKLRDSSSLRESLSSAARVEIERMYGPDSISAQISYFLSENAENDISPVLNGSNKWGFDLDA